MQKLLRTDETCHIESVDIRLSVNSPVNSHHPNCGVTELVIGQPYVYYEFMNASCFSCLMTHGKFYLPMHVTCRKCYQFQ